MPKNSWWPNNIRTKYIHSVGVHGKVKFLSTGNHPYTGIFKGANYGIVRLSAAAKPEVPGIVLMGQPLAPGMGLKFLRDGADSANLVAMYSVNGQPYDWNFFSKDFSNHVGPAEGVQIKSLAAKFATYTPYVQYVGLSDMGAIDEKGAKASKNVFPYSLRFEPHRDVNTLFPHELQNNDPMAYVQ